MISICQNIWLFSVYSTHKYTAVYGVISNWKFLILLPMTSYLHTSITVHYTVFLWKKVVCYSLEFVISCCTCSSHELNRLYFFFYLWKHIVFSISTYNFYYRLINWQQFHVRYSLIILIYVICSNRKPYKFP